MQRLLNAGLALLLIAAVTACGSSTDLTADDLRASTGAEVALPDNSNGRYVVVLSPNSNAADLDSVLSGLPAPPARTYRTAIHGFAAPLSPAMRKRLAADDRVLFIEPDIEFTINKGKPPHAGGGGGGEDPPSENLPWGVARIEAELNAGGGSGVVVAVIDTGIDLDHPDLAGGVVHGYNFVKPGNPADDDNGHGTHVAGTIAARVNGLGVIGVAPNSTVVAVKVLNRRGSGWLSDIIGGIDWTAANAAAYGIQVANMSLGARGSSAAMETAINNASAQGIIFVVAAGNSSANAAGYVPASFANVFCVSAIDSADKFASFSNYGATVEFTAPGVSIPSLYKNGGYKTLSGTSMAAPHVAGAVALWLDDAAHSGAFADVLAALTVAGEAGPWPGDPDGIAEPLVMAAGL